MNIKQEEVRKVLLTPIIVTSEQNHIFKYQGKIYSSQSYPSGLDEDMSDFAVGFYERFYQMNVLQDGKFFSDNYAGDTINTGIYALHQRKKTKLASRHCLANFWLIPYVHGRKGQKPKRDFLDSYLDFVEKRIAEKDEMFADFANLSAFKKFHQIPEQVASTTLSDQRKMIENRANLIAKSKYAEILWKYFNELVLFN